MIAVDKIPTIGMKFVADMIDEPFRSIDADLLVPPDQDPQETIKADKVIDVRVRHTYVLKALDVPRRQRRDIAQVKQDRAPLE